MSRLFTFRVALERHSDDYFELFEIQSERAPISKTVN